MASANLQNDVDFEPPKKRRRTQPPQVHSPTSSPSTDPQGNAKMEKTQVQEWLSDTTQPALKQKVTSGTGFQPEREAQVGILHFVNEDKLGFTGTLKQRYTDFLVNEIAPDGTVVHLTNDKAPKFKDINKEDEIHKGKESAEESPLPLPIPSEVLMAPIGGDTAFSVAATTSLPEAPLPGGSSEAAPSTKAQGLTQELLEKPAFAIAPQDHELLTTYFGAALKNAIVELDEKIRAKPSAKPATFGFLVSDPITDRPLRGRLHGDVRRIFESRIETESMQDTGKIKLSASPPVKPHPEGYVRNQIPNHQQRDNRNQGARQQHKGQPKGKLGWQELGGEHLHFSLYKENKDTMEVISYLSSQLKIKPRDFAFAGTKDRRAVTVQRVSVYRQHAKALEALNWSLRQARIGNFKHEKHRLELGELDGNRFVITLRDCHFGEDDSALDDSSRLKLANAVVGQAVKGLQAEGFLNYFGLQRFGTFGIGTDEIGKKILNGDFEGAVWDILNFSEESLAAAKQRSTTNHDRIARDDIDRALAIDNFRSTGKSQYAIEKLPRKFSAEIVIIRQLSFRPTDFLGALNAISRNLRTMYVHAYQSLVWNMVASKRWSRYGSKVIKGDLVMVDTPAEKANQTRDEVDENGEVVIHAAADDSAFTHDDIYQRARPLTWEEVESGKYTIFDIVLPTPGFDIEYPGNDIGDFYKEFMASERGGRLDPADMRRKVKDFSLSGSYRKLIAQVGADMSFDIKTYKDENEQLVETDWEKLQRSRGRDPHAVQSNYRLSIDGRGGRDARQNGSHGNRQADIRQENLQPSTPMPPPLRDHPKPRNEDVAAKMALWKNLPTKLAEDDKAAAAEWNAKELRNPDDIVQPHYKDTYIQTSTEDQGRRTGFRTTDFIDVEGNIKKEIEVKATHLIPKSPVTGKSSIAQESPIVASDTLEVDKKGTENMIASAVKMKDSFYSIADSTEGGVLLSTASVPPVTSATVLPVTRGTKDEKAEISVQGLSSAANEDTKQQNLIAVIIKFDLGTSQYATMALRELMKLGGVKTYKPDFSMGR